MDQMSTYFKGPKTWAWAAVPQTPFQILVVPQFFVNQPKKAGKVGLACGQTHLGKWPFRQKQNRVGEMHFANRDHFPKSSNLSCFLFCWKFCWNSRLSYGLIVQCLDRVMFLLWISFGENITKKVRLQRTKVEQGGRFRKFSKCNKLCSSSFPWNGFFYFFIMSSWGQISVKCYFKISTDNLNCYFSEFWF